LIFNSGLTGGTSGYYARIAINGSKSQAFVGFSAEL
jgi:hypothetical protein